MRRKAHPAQVAGGRSRLTPFPPGVGTFGAIVGWAPVAIRSSSAGGLAANLKPLSVLGRPLFGLSGGRWIALGSYAVPFTASQSSTNSSTSFLASFSASATVPCPTGFPCDHLVAIEPS